MATVDVEVEALIARPRHEVAAFAVDPDNAPRWYRNSATVRRLDQGPVQVGSRSEFVARFLGRELAYTYEVTELEPGERLVMRTAQGPFPMCTTYRWSAQGSGTRMWLRNAGAPQGFVGVAAPVLARAKRRAMTGDLARLRQLLEG